MAEKRPGRRPRAPAAGTMVKHTLRWSEQTDRDIRALAADRRLTVGELIEPALRAGLLYGFSLTVQEPDRRVKPSVEIYKPPAAGEGSDLAG